MILHFAKGNYFPSTTFILISNQAIQEQQLKALSTFLPSHDQTEQPVAGPSSSSRFTRRKKRLLDAGIEPPPGKREELDNIISPDPLVESLSEPSQHQAALIQSQLRDEDEEDQEEPRNEDNFLDSVSE